AVPQTLEGGPASAAARTPPAAAPPDHSHDGRNRLVREQDPAFTSAAGTSVRTATELVYDGVGNLLTKTEKGTTQDEVTRYAYDPFGNRTRETDAVGNPITYFYDLNGNLVDKHTRRTNPDGTQPAADTFYGYDRLNRQVT